MVVLALLAFNSGWWLLARQGGGAGGAASVVLGLACLGLPAVVALLRPARSTRVLLLAGAGIGLVFLGQPRFDHPVVLAAAMALRNALVLAGIGAALQFTLEFTRPGRRVAWVYTPMAMYWLMLDWRLLAPGASGLVAVVNLAGGVLLAFSMAVLLVTLARACVRGWRLDRPAGLRLLCLGTLAGLLPVAAAGVAHATGHGVLLPPRAWWPLPLLAIPLTWTLVAWRQATCGGAPTGRGDGSQGVKNML